jgi:hypothetical protein
MGTTPLAQRCNSTFIRTSETVGVASQKQMRMSLWKKAWHKTSLYVDSDLFK